MRVRVSYKLFIKCLLLTNAKIGCWKWRVTLELTVIHFHMCMCHVYIFLAAHELASLSAFHCIRLTELAADFLKVKCLTMLEKPSLLSALSPVVKVFQKPLHLHEKHPFLNTNKVAYMAYFYLCTVSFSCIATLNVTVFITYFI